jgi:hypothetical protein
MVVYLIGLGMHLFYLIEGGKIWPLVYCERTINFVQIRDHFLKFHFLF